MNSAHNQSPQAHPDSSVFTMGWTVVAFTAISQFFAVGIGYYTFSVYLKPLSESLGVNRGYVSLVLTLQMFLLSMMAPMVGRVLSHYPLRPLMTGGVFALSAGLIICANATHIYHIFFGFGLVVAVGNSFTGNLPCNMILANWFVKRRGAAIGISQTGVTLSGVLLVPLASYLVLNHGWQNSFLFFAILTPLILLPLIWKFAIKTPQELGLNPDGEVTAQPESALQTNSQFGFAQAIKIKDIWLISLFAGPCYMAIGAVVISLPAHGTDLGLSVLEASTIVSVTTLFGALAKPLTGIVSDYLPKRAVAAAAVALQLIGVLLLLEADTLVALCVAGGLFGLGYGGVAPMWSVLLAERFSGGDFAKAMGASLPITMPFNIAGLPAANFIFEMTGSYIPAFAGLLGVYVISIVCLWLLKPPAQG